MAARKGTHKLNELLDIQTEVQKKWEKTKVFEIDAADVGTDESKLVIYLSSIYETT